MTSWFWVLIGLFVPPHRQSYIDEIEAEILLKQQRQEERLAMRRAERQTETELRRP